MTNYSNMATADKSQLERDVVSRLPRPGFIKRLLVIIYDGLLLVGVIFMASLLFLAIPESISGSIWVRSIKLIYLVGISFLFYGWFWTHGGQTLGMRVWNLYLVDERGKYLRWPAAAQRFVLAAISWLPFGLGYTWILVNKRRATWHDIWCKTSIVRIAPKQTNQT